MSYYFTNPYNFTSHGITRIRDRLKLKTLSDNEIENYCFQLISNSDEIIETKSFKYVRVANSSYYFIIKKNQKLILTLTKISPEKLITILEQDL